MIRADFRNTDTARLGRAGIDLASEGKAWEGVLAGALADLRRRAGDPGDMLGWVGLPEDAGHLEAVREAAGRLPGGITDLVVLGIGGSSLGALAVIRALQHPQRALQKDGHGLRVHFVDNVDGAETAGLLDVLDPRTTALNVISKSGTTAETMAAYLVFRDWLERALGEGYARHVTATTDPEDGILLRAARARGYGLLSVPPSVGGRFSVLSAVGLFPIHSAGGDAAALLRGAREVNAALDVEFADNPLLKSTLLQYLYLRRGRNISVLMPYGSRLRFIGDWFVQLWAESLGKARDRRGSLVNTGSTPLRAVGATDQHSQVQLFNEGPDDKLITFITTGSTERDLTIPAARPGLPELDYLSGRTFSELLAAEQAATAHALMQHGKPNLTLELPAGDAAGIGMLLQFLMWQTALMGELLGIDAFDQPGVELGKVYTYALLGREGFEEQKKELEDAGVG